MPKTDYEAIDAIDVLRAELDALIDSHINSLLTCEAAKHDHITGIIKGLKTAQNRAADVARKWRANDDVSASITLV